MWKNDPDNSILKNEYKNYVKVYDKIIKEAKLKYDNDQIASNLNNTKNLWNIINQKLGKGHKKENNISYIVDESNLKIYDSTEISNTMNSYFCNVGLQLSSNIRQMPESSKDYPLKK